MIRQVIRYVIGGIVNQGASKTIDINILNHSFESPVVPDGGDTLSIDDWNIINGSAGVFGADNQLDILPPPDGLRQVAFSNNGEIYQVLTDTLKANTKYILTVDVGDRDGLDMGAPELKLGTGNTFGANYLARTEIVSPPTINGGWVVYQTTFTTGGGVVGDPLRIELINNLGIQAIFDNVRLTSKPESQKLFVSIFDTSSNSLTLPFTPSPSNLIDWGDGTTNNLNSHTYSGSPATSVVTISGGNVNGYRFANGGDRLKLIDVIRCSSLDVDDNSMFWGCENLVWTCKDAPIITSTDLSSMFRDNTVFNGNLDNWPTGLVEAMVAMFLNAKALDHYMDWDVSSCVNFNSMYSEANAILHNNGSIKYELKPSSNINCRSMFRANNNIDDPMEMTNTSSITNYSSMYSFTSIDILPPYDYSNAPNVGGYCQRADIQGSVVGFNVPLATSLGDSFSNCKITSFTGIVTSGQLTNVQFMFSANTNLTTLEVFDTQNVTTARAMLRNCFAATNIRIDLFNWSSCTNFTNFLTNVTMDTTIYSDFLIALDGYGLSSGTLDGGGSQYNAVGATARANLIGKGWSVIDGGAE